MKQRERDRGASQPAPGRATGAPLAFQTLRQVKQISQDTVAGPAGTEDDTQIEPDLQIDPDNAQVIVAVFQQGRFQSDGGSAAPGYATSVDRGKTWTTAALPKLTKTSGGTFERASDPAVAFGPDGSVYVTTLPFNVTTNCKNGVAVQRSTDHGLTFSNPVLPQSDNSCSAFNDKNWLTVDTYPASPHYGRIYLAWDRISGGVQPVVLRYSDDQGQTWSALKNVSGLLNGVGALPLVQPNGDLTVVYDHLGSPEAIVSQTSQDGGDTFDGAVVIGTFQGGEPFDMRTGGLPTATVDPVTGDLYAGWQDTRFRTDGLNDIVLSRSTDGGAHWSGLVRVNSDAVNSRLEHFTPDVSAYDHAVHVVYRTRNEANGLSNKVGMRYIVSLDDGQTFGGELIVGTAGALTYAALDGSQKFLGDYMGSSALENVFRTVWCRPSAPPAPATYHQTAWGAAVSR